jgi:hypothetical protein
MDWRRFRVVVTPFAKLGGRQLDAWDQSRRGPRFIWEVLLQGKVIRDRPLAGIAHAFVFWGFCAFALLR